MFQVRIPRHREERVLVMSGAEIHTPAVCSAVISAAMLDCLPSFGITFFLLVGAMLFKKNFCSLFK